MSEGQRPRKPSVSKSASGTTSGAKKPTKKSATKSAASKPSTSAKKKKTKKSAQFIERGNARYDRHDTYYRKAKKEGYVARSIYKLEEIDVQYQLVTPSSVVLDLGCAPGSWMQYLSRAIDPAKGGRAVGIDLLPVHTSFPTWVKIIEGDIFTVTDEALLPDDRSVEDEARPFDLVLSDMAPNTTGIRKVDQARSMALAETALAIAERRLKPGGQFCVKILEGGELREFVDACKRSFGAVKIRRPKGTRVGSTETYIVAQAFRPTT